ncbi:DJ-1/PfpI family protein [Streptosporangium sp. NPDC051023]|uniref:DJ-1/PfpI family protein n=1 Tax=Streptosporangium sp. NPDC051023 TaxID=3155410 RepID=UPI00344D1780
MPPRIRRLLRIALAVTLWAAVMAGTCVAGVAVSMRDSYPGPVRAVPAGGWPPAREVPRERPIAQEASREQEQPSVRETPSATAPVRTGVRRVSVRSAPPGQIKVAVVVGASGSVTTDVLGPYEVFARSSRFFVYTVSARREPVPLSGGLRVLPERTLAETAAGETAPDVVVVPAVVDPEGEAEAPLRSWIGRQAARGARILGVCAGSRLVAASGLLRGRSATSHWGVIGPLQQDYPDTRWVRGRRYVEDGPVTTTAGVTSGTVGALRLVERLAGIAEARRVGGEVGYPGWSPDASTAIPAGEPALEDLPYALNAAFPWFEPVVGVGLNQGVSEIDVAAAFEIYAGGSFAARAVALAGTTVVTTRHGMTLVAEPADGTAPAVTRLVAPGVGTAREVDPALVRWAAGRGVAVELPHAGRAAGESGFDPVLRDLAAHTDLATARATAKYNEYPIEHLTLTGPAWSWRPTLLFLLTALGAGLLSYTAVRLMPR